MWSLNENTTDTRNIQTVLKWDKRMEIIHTLQTIINLKKKPHLNVRAVIITTFHNFDKYFFSNTERLCHSPIAWISVYQLHFSYFSFEF